MPLKQLRFGPMLSSLSNTRMHQHQVGSDPLQCQFVTLQLTKLIQSVWKTTPEAAIASLEDCRISRVAELLVECRSNQWLLKVLELTVDADYFDEILRDSRDVLYEAWPLDPNIGQE